MHLARLLAGLCPTTRLSQAPLRLRVCLIVESPKTGAVWASEGRSASGQNLTFGTHGYNGGFRPNSGRYPRYSFTDNAADNAVIPRSGNPSKFA